MEPIRIHIPNELFAPAESTHVEGAAEPGILKSGPDLYTFDGALEWQADITNTGEAFLVMGTVEGMAKTSCARCLEDVEVPLIGEIEGYFLIGGQDAHAPEDLDEDEFELLPDDNAIDMGALITAAVLLELPLVPLCDEECKGLCPTCGANLNDGSCGCAPQQPDPDFERVKNPFAALADYDFGDAGAAADGDAAAGDDASVEEGSAAGGI